MKNVKEFLFLLNSGHAWAFCHPGNGKPLNYRGSKKMPCATAEDVRLFLEYMLKNYGNDGRATRISFLCGDPCRDAALAVAAITGTYQDIPFALYTIPYLLPQFCHKMGIPRQSAACITFDAATWRVEELTVTPCQASGNAPFRLEEKDVARLFFAPGPAPPKTEEKSAPPPVPHGELDGYVRGSRVQPKSSGTGRKPS